MFQSTRPQGARLAIGGLKLISESFQSTRPQGARRASGYGSVLILRFNPRARRGRDRRAARTPARTPVSIHAPAGGAT